MRIFLLLATVIAGIMIQSTLYAAPPVVSHNVTVMKNATPKQCKNWRSDVGPEDNSVAYTVTAGDDTDYSGPGVRSCTSCYVDSTQNCVCKTCYDYFN